MLYLLYSLNEAGGFNSSSLKLLKKERLIVHFKNLTIDCEGAEKMKLFVWCLTVLTSFSLGMLVMFVFNYPYENYGNETKEIKVANVSSSSTSADEIKEPEKFNVSLKEALETYQTCYPNQAITSVKVSQTVGPYYYEITGRDATEECSVRISTKTANIKKKSTSHTKQTRTSHYRAIRRSVQYQKLKKFIGSY